MARCTRCGLDPAEWTAQDEARTLSHTDLLFDLWSAAPSPDAAGLIADLRHDARAAIARSDDADQQIHALWHGLVAIADLRRSLGDVVETHTGEVAQLNRSDGGVPKLPIEHAEVDHHGVVGDVQATRVHHGRPWQALCLWSADVIDEIAGEGHPIRPGAAGENVTIRGVEWGTLRGGTIVDVGSVRCQLSAPAEPCVSNRQWFLDGRIERMDHVRHPGSSRWYATVVRPGAISTGDAVVVEPAS
jgi:MOSC domain-containing protein YiiM